MFANLKLNAKLLSSFTLVALVLVAVGLLAFLGMERMGERTEQIGRTTPLLEAASSLELIVSQDHKTSLAMLGSGTAQALAKSWQEHLKRVQEFDRLIDAMLKGGVIEKERMEAVREPEFRNRIQKADNFHNQKFQPLLEKIHQMKGQGLAARLNVKKAMGEMEAAFDAVLKKASGLEDKIKKIVAGRLASGATAAQIFSTENTWADVSMEIKTTIAKSRIKVEEFAQDIEAGSLDRLAKEYRDTVAEFDQWVKALLSGAKTSEGVIAPITATSLRQDVLELNRIHDQLFQAAVNRMFAAQRIMADLSQKARGLEEEAGRVGQDMSAQLNEMAGLARARLNRALAESRATGENVRWQTVAGVALGFVLAVLFGLAISRNITAPVAHTRGAITVMAKGDFTFQMDAKHLSRGDEIGDMLRDLREMQTQLSGTVREVSNAADSLAAASNQISQGNMDLSDRTQRQASSLEETASALEQLTSGVKQNAQNSRAALDLARKTSEMASRGGKVVNDSMASMNEVSESSNKISEIINVVNEIAFQTNLLALNAAVEAARAGEAGRGFAVVAGEVRNLAGRSASAAKEIQGLISDSVHKVEKGNRLVEESGRLLQDIIANVAAVADTMSEISASSAEQAGGVDEINQAVSQMDDAVQQNAALVEEAASASENVAAAAEELKGQMRGFKVNQGPGSRPALKAAAPAQPKMLAGPAKPAAGSKPRAKKGDAFEDEGLDGF